MGPDLQGGLEVWPKLILKRDVVKKIINDIVLDMRKDFFLFQAPISLLFFIIVVKYDFNYLNQY